MKTLKIILCVVITFSFAIFLGSARVFAQEDLSFDKNTTTLSGELSISETESISAEEDNNLGKEILGVDDPGLLPDSPFYFLKEAVRGISSFLTFSDEKKIEKDFTYASERLAEVNKMLSQTSHNNIKKNEKIVKTLQKYQKDLDKVSSRIKKIEKTSESYNRLLNKSLDKYAAFIKVMSPDEDLALNIEDDIVKKIYESKDQILNSLGTLISGLNNPVQKLEEILQNQPGSKFKEFKNLEILKELENKLPEQALESIIQAQNRIRNRIEEELSKSADGKEGEEFANYVIALKGNQAEHLAILDELSKSSDLPDEVIAGFREAKDKVSINFSKKMINHPEANRMIEEIASGDIDKLRVLESLADALPNYGEVSEELEQARQKAIDRAAEKIKNIGTVEEKISFLLRDGVPDAKSFIILDELQNKFNDKQDGQINEVRNRVYEIFSDIVDNSENRDKLLERLAGDSLDDFSIMAAIRENLPVNIISKFDSLVKNQIKKVEERIENEDDIEKLINMRSRIDNSSSAQKLIKKFYPEMMDKININQINKVKNILNKEIDPVKIVELANKYNDILDKYPVVKDALEKNNLNAVREMVKNQVQIIKEGFSNIENSEELKTIIKRLESANIDKFRENMPEDMQNEIQNIIVNRNIDLQKDDFIEEIKKETGDNFDFNEAENIFNKEIGSLIKYSDSEPALDIFEKIKERVSQQVREVIKNKEIANTIEKIRQGKDDVNSVQNSEEINNQIMDSATNIPSSQNIIDEARKEAIRQETEIRNKAQPTQSEIEKIKQEQIKNIIK